MTAQDPYRYFRLEARELVDQFSAGILELEKGGPDAPLVQRLLRIAHTLKGAARVVKQREIADGAHAIEDALAALRDSAGAVPREGVDTMLRHLDGINARVLALSRPADGAPADAQTRAADEDVRSVRADIEEMDALLDGVTQTHAQLNGVRAAARRVEEARHLADLLVAQLAPRASADHARHEAAHRNGGARSVRAHALAEELAALCGGLERRIGSSVERMDRELQQLRDGAEQLRLVPAATLLASLERTARDAARALSKQVVFEGTGGDIRLDSHVLGLVQGALTQLVRNSVAHGIEEPHERRVTGKPDAGRVAVSVFRRGRRIVFECRDDGRGVDVDAVRSLAARRGALGTDAGRLDAADLVRLLLHGGVSTATAVTEVSGRGVGLDIVREAIERLGGEVTVRTEARAGTTFALVVPPSLTSLDALVVEASGSAAAIPLDAVRSCVRISADEISPASPGASIIHEQRAIPFVALSRLLFGTTPAADRNWTAVVVASADGQAAFGVDRLRGTARVVVRPLGEHAAAGAIVSGASLDAEGNPQLVLDPDGLVAESRRAGVAAPDHAAAKHAVLVVDDSLTTRMLEQSILESAGYAVDVALSAEEGLEAARRRKYALFLVDVEMPGMDGFTFVERVRADPLLFGVPAILVTSRAAPEDRERGRAAGAQGYIVKSEFDQNALLAMIRPLVE